MPCFKEGDKVRVKGQPSFSYRGKVGTIICSHIYGLAITYDVTFDKIDSYKSAIKQFFEYDLERITC